MNKNTLNLPLSPLPGGLFISSPFEGVCGGGGGGGRGGVIETRGGVAYMYLIKKGGWYQLSLKD